MLSNKNWRESLPGLPLFGDCLGIDRVVVNNFLFFFITFFVVLIFFIVLFCF